jgi:formyl-CoA transferase
MFVECEHPTIGHMRINGCPVKMMDTMPTVKTPAPMLGEYNESIYESVLGYSKEKLEALKKEGII